MTRIEISGERPLALTKAELKGLFGKWPKEVDRMLWASRNGQPWLVFIANKEGSPGLMTRVTTASAEAAFDRLLAGERPPRLPSERKPKKRKILPSSISEVEVENLVEHLLEITKGLPREVIGIDLNREAGSVFVSLSDGSSRICRLAKARPAKKRAVMAVTFVKNSRRSESDSPYPEGYLEEGDD